MNPMSLSHLRWQVNYKQTSRRNSRVFSVRIPVDMYIALVRRAHSQGRRHPDVVRALIASWLESYR